MLTSTTHWSRRTLASATGISTTTVHRYMSLFGLQPRRSKSFKLSNDPFFIEKDTRAWCSESQFASSSSEYGISPMLGLPATMPRT